LTGFYNRNIIKEPPETKMSGKRLIFFSYVAWFAIGGIYGKSTG
jgi:hypothetical protein